MANGLPGAPTVCTPETIAAYCDAIRGVNGEPGLSIESAASRAGTNHESIRQWRERGAKGEEPYATFVAEEKKAFADWEEKRLLSMDASGPNWTREAWKLERRMRAAYGKQESVDLKHSGDAANPVQFVIGVVPATDVDSVLAEIGANDDGPPDAAD